MLLSLRERLTLVNVLPAEGSLVTMKARTDLRNDLLPTPQEITDWEIEEVEGGGTRWNPDLVQDVDIQIPVPAMSIIVEALTALDVDKKLTEEHLTLCEKFLEGSA